MPKKSRQRLAHAPKKPASSYLSFCSHLRKTDEALKSMAPSDQRQHFATKWRTLSDTDRKGYEDDYQQRLQAYREEYKKYKASDLYKQDCEAIGKESKKKRPKSAYNVFVAEEYKKVEGSSFGEHTAELSRRWKSMNEEEKMVFRRKAEELRKENMEE
ncbi:putative High mobility group, HMG1/HMG2, High mobility group, superfamily protein [Trachipleistophora hominis]|uniref:Putative High mobility group, HMG1/HMG2, High mobility group, superfamily protein n=1 Tax=Trachipleistophora hominis TaxID=72359 RepID=L7K099_TRAHO|nr:putative High mobility group, HMG1/HMG2, High mobility group, superfamily protein [Trachipleistophora hominis]